jgi:hypothetical protein
MAVNASEQKNFGKFVLPAWLALAWSGFWAIVDWLGRFQLLRDSLPFRSSYLLLRGGVLPSEIVRSGHGQRLL